MWTGESARDCSKAAPLAQGQLGPWPYLGFAAVVTFIMLKMLDATMGLRVSQQEEIQGLDFSQHGEEGLYLYLRFVGPILLTDASGYLIGRCDHGSGEHRMP